MNQSTETVSARDLFRLGCCQRSSRRPFLVGPVHVERSVWPVVAVMVDKDTEHPLEMTSVDDQEPVEAFPSDGADEAFGYRVCLRRSDRRADDLDSFASEDGVEVARELAVAIMDEEAKRERSLA